MANAAELTPGSIFARDYRIDRRLAQGGMGAVYIAEQLSTGARRALKVMHPSLVADAKSRARFAQEARVGAWIGSDHVVDVIAAGIDEASHIPWIAMELLQGETVAERLARVGRGSGLPLREVHAILTQLGRALTAAHARNIVHRDLKPENVFLCNAPHGDAPFTVKVLDFGIAKAIDPTRPGQNVTTAFGTPLWMSPEQNTTSSLSPAADIWAAGLLAFRLITGRYYWLAANERELNIAGLVSELMNEPLPSASARAAQLGVAPLIPPGFDAWFGRCVARDPSYRFTDGAAMSAALDGALGPALSSPPAPSPSPLPPAPYAMAPSAAATQALSGLPLPPASLASPRGSSGLVRVIAAAGVATLLVVLALVAWWLHDDGPPARAQPPSPVVVVPAVPPTMPSMPSMPSLPTPPAPGVAPIPSGMPTAPSGWAAPPPVERPPKTRGERGL